MSISTLSQIRLGNPLSRFLRRVGSWINVPLNPRAIAALLLSLLPVLLTLTRVSAQTKYTADFSTSPTFDYEGGQTYYKTKTTVNINGVNYLIHNAINADFTWTGSAVSYNPYSGVSLLIERQDQQLFTFYGIDLNYTSVNTDLAHAPWLTVSYQGANGQATSADAYNETSKNFSVSKPAGLAVKYVQLYFADVATLVLDNLIVGPATTTPACTSPTLPTISATKTAICAGSTTTLSIQSGSLNDATNWKWYSGSCGGTLVGTGSSIQVNPGSTTTYYVRGEGGCVTPGSCASQTITVSAPPQPPAVSPLSYCQGATATSLTANGTNLRFYNTPTGGSSLAGAPTPSTAQPGATTYFVTQTNGTGCESTRSALTVRVNPLPGAPGVQPVTYCQFATAVPLTATASMGNSLRWYSPGGSLLTGAPTPSTTVPATTTYYVSETNGFGCEGPRAAITVTVNALPTVSISGLASAYCQDAGIITLNGTPQDGRFTLDGTPATNVNTANLSLGQHTAVYSYTNTNGCVNATSQTFTIKPTPAAPSLVTASGQPFPVGVSTLTASQNTGSVILTVGGCSGGTITWNGGNSTTLAVSTSTLGTQTYTATCTQDGCTSPVASFLLTVVPTSLSVLHRDQDYGNTQNNIIKPFLELANAGSQAIPYSEVTVRYWLTSEGNAPATNFAVYYAPLGAVNMRYVMLAQPRQGAFGYVEYSFPGGGSLPMNGNSGPIENGIQKTDGSPFNESNDYSYQANYANYTPNSHITAYRNGVIVWGQEPTVVTSQTAVQVYSAAMDNPTASQIKTRVELRNTGNVPLPVSGLKLRYYFTSDNGQLANVYVDYADMGTATVQARVVQLASPVNGADSYVELSFSGNTGQLNPLSSLGFVDFRLVRSDYGLFNQANDYSYAANYGNVGLNNRITAYLNNNLVFGTPASGASARMIAQEPTFGFAGPVIG